MSVIEIEQLSKSYRVYQKQEGLLAALRGLFRREYREVQAVRDVSLAVNRGEFVAFLGPNGAGKTTTLKLLSGVIYPTGGTARVLGECAITLGRLHPALNFTDSSHRPTQCPGRPHMPLRSTMAQPTKAAPTMRNKECDSKSVACNVDPCTLHIQTASKTAMHAFQQ